MMTALFLVVALGPQRTTLLTGQDTLMSVEMNMYILLAMGVASLVLYMQRLRAVDALLPPTTAAIALLISMALAGQTVEMPSVQTTALVMFVLVGAYLAFQGDVRSGRKPWPPKRNGRHPSPKSGSMQSLVSSTADGTTTVALKQLDAELLALSQRQKKRAKRGRQRGG